MSTHNQLEYGDRPKKLYKNWSTADIISGEAVECVG